MAAHLTEEEQIEAIKRWWKDNGKFTVALILAVVLGWFGWTSWQDRQERVAQQASTQYAELMAAVEVEPGGTLSEEQAATARVIANEILEAQADGLYGNFAGLFLAQLGADAGQLDEAAAQLQQVVDNASNTAVERLAQLRLARVLTAQGNYDRALEQLTTNVGEAYQAAYDEARGDVHMARDELTLAQTAYESALASLQPQQAGRRSLVQLKLDNTRVANTETDNTSAANDAAGEGEA